MKRYFTWYALLLLLVVSACNTTKKLKPGSYTLDPVEIRPEDRTYQGSATRKHDLIKTKLDVSFDFAKQHLMGKANLTLKPYFYSTSELTLDAKGFEIVKLGIVEDSVFSELPYTYDTLQLHIDLQKEYTREDTFEIFIEYVAKPNELESGGSAAITSDKGLYFINPLGKEKNKPMQVWTQGETEASSAWFPTIDKPNERTYQEIYITVPDGLVTLSNGLLISSQKNEDGTRTDYWKQTLPHAPYLFMMAIGEFFVVEDKWKDINVPYYIEKDYAPYAEGIFGASPEMLEFFSKVLDYTYPWDKFAQVIVRDYVSGAMENTGAVIYGEFVNQTTREMIDGNYEDIVAHELFHHWFGDLVTCESWSNLPLNESFATYGEYLWREYKYGDYKADQQLHDWYQKYFMEAQIYQKPLIRYYYDDKEDMFDTHSYDKGGAILHMLRNYVGDKAFFESLNLYLTDNEFESVEIHDLRLAFEEITGEDMNWFFNQWFLSPGHPDIVITYDYKDSLKAVVTIEQKQDLEKTPLYKLPLAVDLYFDDSVRRESIVVDQQKQSFEFSIYKQPDLINVDADKILLAKKDDQKSTEEFAFQYYHAPLYADKIEALNALEKKQDTEEIAFEVFTDALSHFYWDVRKTAVEKISLEEEKKDETAKLLSKIALADDHSHVRAAAVKRLNSLANKDYAEIYKKALQDSSFRVIATALKALHSIDKEQAYLVAPDFEDFNNYHIVSAIGEIYADTAQEVKQYYFEQKILQTDSWARYNVLTDYGVYLKRMNQVAVKGGVKTLNEVATNSGSTWHRYAATAAINSLKQSFEEMLEKNKKSKSSDDQSQVKKGYDEATLQSMVDDLKERLDTIIAQETNEKLLKRYKNFN